MPTVEEFRDMLQKTLGRLSGGWGADLALACGFLTRIPIPGATPATEPETTDDDEDTDATPALSAPLRPLAEASRAFPLIGALVGACAGAGIMVAFWAGLHPMASALVALAVAAIVTGGLHEDGLADVADGFGGGTDKSKKLRIMRDSRIGSYGVLALIFSVGLRAAALAGMPSPGMAALALIVAAALSRGTLPGILLYLPAVRRTGLSKGAGKPEPELALLSMLIAAVLSVVIVGFGGGVTAIIAALAGAVAVSWLALRQIGGHTGDVMGAAQQASETLALLALASVL